MRPVRWVSLSGEFAFLSVGGSATGIIAVGGNARGVVAIGAIASAGVISIGMNAIGSVAALGMNTLAPISISLINGLGLYTYAGVNGWGAWSTAGTNSTGLWTDGGVNSGHSVLPAVLVIVIMLVVSSAVRGKRTKRKPVTALPLRRFIRSPELLEVKAVARLTAIRGEDLELTDGRELVTARASESLRQHARALIAAGETKAPEVVASVARVEERVPGTAEVGYRDRSETTRVVVQCLEIEPAPEREGWLPKDADEVQWVIAWSARIVAVVATGALAWLGLFR